MRQAWINDLRKRLAEFLSLSERLVYAQRLDQELYKSFTRVAELSQEIELALNPKEDEHNALLSELATMQLATSQVLRAEFEGRQEENKVTYALAKKNALELSKEIFKQEWERIKGWARTRRWWREHFDKKKAF